MTANKIKETGNRKKISAIVQHINYFIKIFRTKTDKLYWSATRLIMHIKKPVKEVLES